MGFALIALEVGGGLVLVRPVGYSTDWCLPLNRQQAFEGFSSLLTSWREHNLGMPQLYPFELPLKALYACLAAVGITGWRLGFVIVTGGIFLAGVGTYRLLREWMGAGSLSAFLGGTFYALNPIFFNRVSSGQLAFIVSMALLPEAVLRLNRLKKGWRGLPPAVLVCWLGMIQVQFVAFLGVLCLLIIALEGKKGWRVFPALLLALLLHTPAWLRLVEERRGVGRFIGGATTGWMVRNSPKLWDAVRLLGSPGSFYSKSSKVEALVCFWFGGILVLGFVVGGRRGAVLGGSAVLFILLSSGSSEPAGRLYIFLFEYFPPAKLFRQSYHFAVIPSLLYALLLGVLKGRSSALAGILIFVSAFPLVSWRYRRFLSGGGGEAELMELQSVLKGRTLWLPMTYPIRPPGADNEGMDPIITFSPAPTAGNTLPPGVLQSLVLHLREGHKTAGGLLRLLGFQWVIVREQYRSLPLAYEPPGATARHFLVWRTQTLQKNLSELPELVLVDRKPGLFTLYRVRDYAPSVYLSKKLVVVDGGLDDIVKLGELERGAVFGLAGQDGVTESADELVETLSPPPPCGEDFATRLRADYDPTLQPVTYERWWWYDDRYTSLLRPLGLLKGIAGVESDKENYIELITTPRTERIWLDGKELDFESPVLRRKWLRMKRGGSLMLRGEVAIGSIARPDKWEQTLKLWKSSALSKPLMLRVIPGDRIGVSERDYSILCRVERRKEKEVVGIEGKLVAVSPSPFVLFGKGLYPYVRKATMKEEWRFFGTRGELLVVNPAGRKLESVLKLRTRAEVETKVLLRFGDVDSATLALIPGFPKDFEKSLVLRAGTTVISLYCKEGKKLAIEKAEIVPLEELPSIKCEEVSGQVRLNFGFEPYAVYAFEFPLEGFKVREYPILDLFVSLFDRERLDVDLLVSADGNRIILRNIDAGLYRMDFAKFVEGYLREVGREWSGRLTSLKVLVHRNWFTPPAYIRQTPYVIDVGKVRFYRVMPVREGDGKVVVRVGREDFVRRVRKPGWLNLGWLSADGVLGVEEPEAFRVTDIYLRSVRVDSPERIETPEIKRLSATEYRVRLRLDGRRILVLNQSYHPGWRLRGVEAERHFVANGFANGWIMRGRGEVEVEIYFGPEKLYRICLAFSLACLAVVLGLFARRRL